MLPLREAAAMAGRSRLLRYHTPTLFAIEGPGQIWIIQYPDLSKSISNPITHTQCTDLLTEANLTPMKQNKYKIYTDFDVFLCFSLL